MFWYPALALEKNEAGRTIFDIPVADELIKNVLSSLNPHRHNKEESSTDDVKYKKCSAKHYVAVSRPRSRPSSSTSSQMLLNELPLDILDEIFYQLLISHVSSRAHIFKLRSVSKFFNDVLRRPLRCYGRIVSETMLKQAQGDGESGEAVLRRRATCVPHFPIP
jgi:hypothetical protein